MTHLSRLVLNPRSREVRRDLADCHALHVRLMQAFPNVLGANGAARASLGVLHRVDRDRRTGLSVALVQSADRPDWALLPPDYFAPPALAGAENPASKNVTPLYDALAAGDELVFRLLANPTRKVGTQKDADGNRSNGKRVELRGEDAWQQWLARKAEQGGFRVLAVSARAGASPVPDARTVDQGKVLGTRTLSGPSRQAGESWRESDTERQPLTFGAVVFEGRLEIADPALFRQTLEHGIGSGKAYGFGLLSIARPVSWLD